MSQCHEFVISDRGLNVEVFEEGSSGSGGVFGPGHSGRVKKRMEQHHNFAVSTSEHVGMEGEKFKPGWRDIFRMNQKELEAAIRKVSSDSSLDPRRKAYLMQNLMTRLAKMSSSFYPCQCHFSNAGRLCST
jgi:hypothetical protein